MNWKFVIISILLVALICVLFLLVMRGFENSQLRRENQILTVETASLAHENARLRVSAKAVSEAAGAQSLICRIEKQRLERIEEIKQAAGPSAPILVEAIDEKASCRAIEFINNDLFGSVGNGLRRKDSAFMPGSAALPGSGRAGFFAPEP